VLNCGNQFGGDVASEGGSRLVGRDLMTPVFTPRFLHGWLRLRGGEAGGAPKQNTSWANFRAKGFRFYLFKGTQAGGTPDGIQGCVI